MDKKKNESISRKELIEEVSLTQFSTQLAFILATPVILFAFIGWWMDGVFHTKLTFVIIGTACGVIIASALAVRKVTEVIKRSDEQYEQLKELKNQKNKK